MGRKNSSHITSPFAYILDNRSQGRTDRPGKSDVDRSPGSVLDEKIYTSERYKLINTRVIHTNSFVFL